MRKTIELGTVISLMLTLAACEEQRTQEREPTPAEREPQTLEPVPQEPTPQEPTPQEQGAPEQAPMFEEHENIEPAPREQEPLEGAFEDPLDEGLQDEDAQQARTGEAQSFQLPAASFTAEDVKTRAQATLRDKDGNALGTATFMVVPFGVAMTFEGQNLPAGTHGFHIHETGRCNPPDFESAGEHFNPTDSGHGFADAEDAFHLGDMPNLEVGEDGTASMHYLLPGLNLKSGHTLSLLDSDGSALILHSDPDDYASDPAGNAGSRIGCGVVQKTSPDVG